jgi:hypothetical protein
MTRVCSVQQRLLGRVTVSPSVYGPRALSLIGRGKQRTYAISRRPPLTRWPVSHRVQRGQPQLKNVFRGLFVSPRWCGETCARLQVGA